MINTKLNRTKLYMKLDNLDIISKVKDALKKHGYMIRVEDGKFVPRSVGLGHETPWVHTKHLSVLRCDIYHTVFFQVMEHIHSACRSCWKIVVRPQTVEQLFDLYELQKEMDVPAKCGLEKRKNVYGNYGGYFYTRSKEAGLQRWQEVRTAVDNFLSPDVPVILKRYCTEFELGGEGMPEGQGPSDQLGDVTDEERDMEQYIESHFPPSIHNPAPEHIHANTMKRWIHHAYETGDETYKKFIDKDSLFKPYVYYHPEKEKDDGTNP